MKGISMLVTGSLRKKGTAAKAAVHRLRNKRNDCSNCKYSLKQKGTAAKEGVHRFALNELKCKVFRTIFVSETPDSIQKEQPQTQSFTVPLQKEPYWNFYIDTKIAREDEKLCGKSGKYFKPKE